MPNASNSDARKRLAEREHAGCEDASSPGCRHEALVLDMTYRAALAETRAEDAEAESADLRATLAAVRTYADELDAGASLRWTEDVAKELRGVVGGGSA